jgi:hypothetical protein
VLLPERPPEPKVTGRAALPYKPALPLCAPKPPWLPPPPVVVEIPRPESLENPPPLPDIVPLIVIVLAEKLVDPMHVIAEPASRKKSPAVKEPSQVLQEDEVILTVPRALREGEVLKDTAELVQEKSKKLQLNDDGLESVALTSVKRVR